MEKFSGAARLNLQEPFSKIFEKASSLLALFSGAPKAPALDGEILYSKNNVCVHQIGSEDPVPGYLSLRCSISEMVWQFMSSNTHLIDRYKHRVALYLDHIQHDEYNMCVYVLNRI